MWCAWRTGGFPDPERRFRPPRRVPRRRDDLAANAIIGSLMIQPDGTYAWPSVDARARIMRIMCAQKLNGEPDRVACDC